MAKINQETLALIDNLKDTLKGVGVGISAPQIGRNLRICLVYSKNSRRLLTLINPEILWESKRISKGVVGSKNPYEGCLSVPGIWGIVERHKQIKVRYLTPTKHEVVRKFSGFNSVVLQHEIDHLNGILFIDRVREQQGKLYKLEKNEEGKKELIEVKLT